MEKNNKEIVSAIDDRSKEEEEVQSDVSNESENRLKLFNVEGTCCLKLVKSNINPRANNISQTAIVQNEVHLWGHNLQKNDGLQKLDNDNIGHIHHNKRVLRNVTDSIPSV